MFFSCLNVAKWPFAADEQFNLTISHFIQEIPLFP
jgi:hypothetical protein